MSDKVKLAKAFAQLVIDAVGQDVEEINRRNRTEDRSDCASTDFCPAKAFMLRAWQATISGALPKVRGQRRKAEADLYNGAWELAAKAGFDPEKIK